MDIEAEAEQILSQFKRRKTLEAKSKKTMDGLDGDSIETLESELSKKHGFPVKLTKSMATMYEALMEPKPTDKGGRGIKRKPLPSYISRKRLQQCRYILKRSEKLAEDVMADAKSIDEALDEIRYNYTPETRAIHEAGHGVIGRILGLTCGDCSIVRCKEHDGVSSSSWFDDENRKRPKRYGRDAEVMTSMAGSEAEKELLGRCCDGDGSDREDILLLFARPKAPCESSHTDYEKTEARLRRMTRMLCKRHQASIELIAKRLVEVNTLSGRQIDEILSR
jgi:hypothetical protein